MEDKKDEIVKFNLTAFRKACVGSAESPLERSMLYVESFIVDENDFAIINYTDLKKNLNEKVGIDSLFGKSIQAIIEEFIAERKVAPKDYQD